MRPGPEGHGLSAREQQVMDLFDAGRTQPEIVAETGMAPIWVKQIVRAYDYASIWSNSARFERNARIACAAHASAIAATGRSYA